MTRVQLPYRFETDDIMWQIIEKYGLSSGELRELVLLYLHSIANEDDEVSRLLSKALNEFTKRGENIDRRDMKKIFSL